MCLIAGEIRAQSLALVTPNRTALDKKVVDHVKAAYLGAFKIHDPDMTESAFASTGRGAAAFNMTVDDARDLAAVIGCDFLIIIRTGTQRRAAIETPDYFESFAAFFVISGRTGRLIKWELISEKGADARDAEHRLVQSRLPPVLFDAMTNAWKIEPTEMPLPALEQVPDASSPAAKDFRAPVPYRRLKPEYTRLAYLYDVTATVEAIVDLDEKGRITRAEIGRWAGYGLDESVLAAIRAMNWRQAERAGKPLPIRFLLRYNFKKIDKE